MKAALFLSLYIYYVLIWLTCSTQDLGSSLQHAGSFTVACQLLVAACRDQFPDRGWNLGPLSGSTESQPPDHQVSPCTASYSGATGNISVHHRFTDLDKSPCISSLPRGCCFVREAFSHPPGPKSRVALGWASPSSSLACQ